MAKCESESFPCYNKAEYIVKLRPTTFNKKFSNKIDTFRLCKQCHDFINPDNKDVVYLDKNGSIEAFLSTMREVGVVNEDEIYDNFKILYECGEIDGYMFTFRRLR